MRNSDAVYCLTVSMSVCGSSLCGIDSNIRRGSFILSDGKPRPEMNGIFLDSRGKYVFMLIAMSC